ncbi:peptide chain release factor H [Ascidiimonas sp. W6]|uniref:peptide chain release factor H n=1 Tax=Ascidiimonas meishanensis TaxID=3128903 RepID=UPI0030EED72D
MNKIIQITAGRGPAECCWVVSQILKQFLNEVRQHALDYEILHREEGPENGTLQSVTLLLKGDAEALLKTWTGTLQWIGSSTYRKYHKRKNWFVGLFEMEHIQPETVKETDITYQAIRSSGPGGQHVNKVSSAVRATYIPNGLTVVAMDNRSQHQNKKLAKQRLIEKVAQNYWEVFKKNKADQWENHVHLQRGNPVRIFRGTDFKKEKKTTNFKAIRQTLKSDLKKETWKL